MSKIITPKSFKVSTFAENYSVLNFYPGPSRLYDSVAGYLSDAYHSGILSANHRSSSVMQVIEETTQLFSQKMAIPPGYELYFVSSATEAWEIVGQSLTKKNSLHLYSGAFGKKWFSYASNLVQTTTDIYFDASTPISQSHNLTELSSQANTLALVHNETSNGSQLTENELTTLRHDDLLTVIDATSSMGGVALPWALGDVWFASVQKCFGLPAGMALLVCSPRAIARAEEIGERHHYNSLLNIRANALKFQTHHTPNVLNIYLLRRILEAVAPIDVISTKTKARAKELYTFFAERTEFKPLIENAHFRSDTVIALSVNDPKTLITKAKAAEIILGKGYGDWAENTVRIANFPAIPDTEFDTLRSFFIDYV